MISQSAMRRAVGRISLLKYFQAGNSEAIAAVCKMIAEIYSTDADVERAVSNILHDPRVSEWHGPGAFFESLKTAVYSRGMRLLNGKWVPDPANGKEFDIIYPDGTRHWTGGMYFVYPQAPWREAAPVADTQDDKEL